MARYIGPSCKLCRREATKLFLKGTRCLSDLCALERRNYPPGEHGQRRSKPTDYGLQLREKQKARRMYGILEKQFRGYYYKAASSKGITGTNLLILLERRLDNIVYRMGFAASRNQARHLVRYGHFWVNGKRVDIPSYLVKKGDIVQVAEKSRELGSIKQVAERGKTRAVPEWLNVEFTKLKGSILDMPEREQINVPLEEQMIVNLYSK